MVIVIPFSTHFTNWICADYLAYVEETIEEADTGAAKVNEIISANEEEGTFFEKISEAFNRAMKGASDLLDYFNNVIKKCVNSIAIMIVTTFVLPLLLFLFFRWLLKELFSLHLSVPHINIRLPHPQQDMEDKKAELICEEKES